MLWYNIVLPKLFLNIQIRNRYLNQKLHLYQEISMWTSINRFLHIFKNISNITQIKMISLAWFTRAQVCHKSWTLSLFKCQIEFNCQSNQEWKLFGYKQILLAFMCFSTRNIQSKVRTVMDTNNMFRDIYKKKIFLNCNIFSLI